MQFDRTKLKAVISHVAAYCDPERLGAVKLHKVLYFVDMISFAQRGVAVTGATYTKRPFGPTCLQLLPSLRDMQIAGDIEVRDVSFHGLSKKEYHVLRPSDPRTLNADEIDLIEEVADFVCNQNSARSISEYSHQLPWEMAEFGEEIPYSTALLLFPSDVGPDEFEIAGEGVRDVAQARLNNNTVDLPLLATLRSRVRSQMLGA